MDDRDVVRRISALVDEEHHLQRDRPGNALGDNERRRLHDLEVALDQCWDLLRQRRARRAAGEDPGESSVRSETTVEGYQQ